MEEKLPARLHSILAKDSPNAIVFRRGPSKRVCTFLWDRRKNTFKIGQWLKGRIYERRADISPDGKYLIYFAMNGKLESETGGSWTAISKVPWLKAVELYGKGDCWEGGGLFLSNRSFWLNDSYLDGKSLVWASKGCIYRASIQSGAKIRDPKMLYDFNSVEFDRIRAPYKKWLTTA